MKKSVILLFCILVLSVSLSAITKPKPYYHGQGYSYKYHGHKHHQPNNYRGHWNSLDNWKDYYKHHKHEYRNGRYYRKGKQLYFKFDNGDGEFLFSIGK